MPEIYRLKMWGDEGMPPLKGPAQFLPVNTQSSPRPSGTGGQANSIFIEGYDLQFVRNLNPSPGIQRWAIQSENRSIYIEDKQCIARKQREIRQELREAIRLKKSKEVLRALNRLLIQYSGRKAWSWVTVVKWPIIMAAGELILAQDLGKWFRVIGIPDGFDPADISHEKTPWWVQTMHTMRTGTNIKGSEFQMAIFDPAGRRREARRPIEGIFIRATMVKGKA